MHSQPHVNTILVSRDSYAIRSGPQQLQLVAGGDAQCPGRTPAQACVGVQIEHLKLRATTPLRAGDRIVSLNGMPVRTPDAFVAQLRVLARSGQVHLGVLRAGRRMDFTQAQIAPFIALIVRQPVPPKPPLPPPPPPPPLPPLKGGIR